MVCVVIWMIKGEHTQAPTYGLELEGGISGSYLVFMKDHITTCVFISFFHFF
jgi:hypothetical protein